MKTNQEKTSNLQQFASDNYSGICPEAMEYLQRANLGHDCPYGEDQWTTLATDAFRELFETSCEVFFVFNGTAANSLALSAMCRSYHSIICAETAHIETDECGAPEFFSNGTKILLGKNLHGKLVPDEIDRIVEKRADIHYPKPKIVSLTQATELGTVYSRDEVLALREKANHHNLRMHMDGARFANAVATLGVKPREITWECGVDVLCFGGTKNGMGMSEAIIFFDTKLALEFDYQCKQAGQLASKMRFIAAPWAGILETGAWLRNAEHANRCASLLEERLRTIPEIHIMFPRQANSVFVEMPPGWLKELRARGWRFYTFIGVGGARFMCSWDTTEARIDELIADIEDLKRQMIC
jgi:threonine aldolase